MTSTQPAGPPAALTEIARTILHKRYLIRDDQGNRLVDLRLTTNLACTRINGVSVAGAMIRQPTEVASTPAGSLRATPTRTEPTSTPSRDPCRTVTVTAPVRPVSDRT